MERNVVNNYNENIAEIERIENLDKELDARFKKLTERYNQLKKEYAEQIKSLRHKNFQIARENYTFSFEEVFSEFRKVAKEHGLPDLKVKVGISSTIWNSGRIKRTLKSCRKYLADPDNKYYANNSYIYIEVLDKDGPAKKFYFDKWLKLNFDMKLCDGSKLENNLNTQLGYDDVQGCYYTDLVLKDEAKKYLPITIDITNYIKSNPNEELVNEALRNLQAKRHQTSQERI